MKRKLCSTCLVVDIGRAKVVKLQLEEDGGEGEGEGPAYNYCTTSERQSLQGS